MERALNGKEGKGLRSPLKTVVILAVSVVVVESVLMLLINLMWPAMHGLRENLIDSFLLVSLLFPVFYYFVFKPSALLIKKLEQEKEALRKSEEQYKTLAEGAQDCIFIIDRDDNVKYVNSFSAKMLGLSPDEVIGRPREQFFQSGISDQMKHGLLHVFQSGEPLYKEHIMIYQGRECWQSTWLIPIKDATGEVSAVMGIGRDMTETMEAEGMLKQRIAELEQFRKVTIKRELRMKELKDRVRELEDKLGISHE